MSDKKTLLKFIGIAGLALLCVYLLRKKGAASLLGFEPSEELLDAIELVESGGKANAVSPVGARGAYQFMPKTWVWIWTDIIKEPQNADFDKVFDRDLSRRAAGAYLTWIKRYLSKKGIDSMDAVYAAYNAGPTAVAKAKGVPNIKETRDYVDRVNAALAAKR